MIGTPSDLAGQELPEGHEWGDTSTLDRKFPEKFVKLGEISSHLGVDAKRWAGE